MAQWTMTGLATDGSTIQLENGAQFQLAATLYGEDVSRGSAQDSTHISLGGEHFCVNNHLNNTKYISPTQLQINNGITVSVNPATPLPAITDVPLKLTFSHTDVVTVTNPSIEAYDPTAPTSGSLADMSIYALEVGNHTAWRNINGTAATFSSKSGADTYDWYFALSAIPIHGEPKTFGLRFVLSWV